MIEELAVVRLAVDIPEEGLLRGAVGTVLMIHRTPSLGYEVELERAWSHMFAVTPEQIEPA